MKQKKRKSVDKSAKSIKITPFFEENKLSYTKIHLWHTSRGQFIDIYFKKTPRFSTPEIKFGKYFAEKIESNHPLISFVPRYDISEYELDCVVEGVPCIGYIDSIRKDYLAFMDHKTGKVPWTAARARAHIQLDMYSLLTKIKHGFPAEDARIVWIETQYRQHESRPKSVMWNKSENDIILTGKVEQFHRIITNDDRETMKKIIVQQAKEIEEAWRDFNLTLR